MMATRSPERSGKYFEQVRLTATWVILQSREGRTPKAFASSSPGQRPGKRTEQISGLTLKAFASDSLEIVIKWGSVDGIGNDERETALGSFANSFRVQTI
jgi:hypothetical protein